MPHFVSSLYQDSAVGRIGFHNHDGISPLGMVATTGMTAGEAHRTAQKAANTEGASFIEVADANGNPCTIFPNNYKPERQSRIEEEPGL